MEAKEIVQKIRSVKLCLMAHPHNEHGSEFRHRIDDLIDLEVHFKEQLSKQWVDVNDRLPEDGTDKSIYCLVVSKYDGIVVRPYNQYHKCWDDEDGDDHYCEPTDGKITHWMPLPEPPENNNNKSPKTT